MANRMQDDDIARLYSNKMSEDDENYPSDSDHNSDHISEASESDSDTDMEDPEPVEETPPTLPFYTGKDGKTKWYKTPPRTNVEQVHMFNNRIERKKSNIRRNFIKQLGLSLLEDHLRKRKDNPHVPRDIRKRIHQILDEEVPGYCACGGTCDGVIKNDPNENFVEIMCTIAKGDGKCGKRSLRSEKRKKIIAEIGQQTVHAYRAEKAADTMEFGDSEPPNLPSSPVLRNARYEERKKNFIHKNPILAVQILKHNQGKFIIRDIHLDPFAVHYWRRQQLGMYKSYVDKGHSCLCIDATGGLFRPLIKYKDIKSKYIYLYHGVIRVEAGQFPVVQMISETQTSDDIHGWLTKWVTSGAPPASEIVIDCGLGLLTGAIRTFTSGSTIHEYADAGYGPIVPSCYIRMDNAHYIKTWVDLLKGMHPQIKVFYQGVIGRLIICSDRNEAKSLINSILILCQSETYGKLEDGTDSAAGNAYNYLKAMITGTDLSDIDLIYMNLLACEEGGPFLKVLYFDTSMQFHSSHWYRSLRI
ncbi:120.7 kDa protein in NOF-FB transposable element [Eumeta japonica]|uniref:120.7 kDa protein in NOF-FB transposable element n=1 Tax=Eumeta variegata TaxID=151549 RepID=A0A4C1XT40_EUMVA|nr:120.7 kDa protein in NOF-FB transposable element [Eumeta japonica]